MDENPRYCYEECVFAQEGHCGQTKYEFYTHCEKLFNQNKPQRNNMKVGIIGHVDHGKSCMTSAIIEVMKSKGVEVVTVDEKECFDRGIRLTSIVKDEALRITNETCHLFSPPMSRAERRKIQRKSVQKRK